MTTRLRDLLHAEPPKSVLALSEEVRDELAAVISHALHRQAHDLHAAYEASMRHVPFPIRGIVKKVLGA